MLMFGLEGRNCPECGRFLACFWRGVESVAAPSDERAGERRACARVPLMSLQFRLYSRDLFPSPCFCGFEHRVAHILRFERVAEGWADGLAFGQSFQKIGHLV